MNEKPIFKRLAAGQEYRRTNPHNVVARKGDAVLEAGHGIACVGVENEQFSWPNTMMLFGDAKKTVESIVKSLAH
jgi:hypothetical protein